MENAFLNNAIRLGKFEKMSFMGLFSYQLTTMQLLITELPLDERACFFFAFFFRVCWTNMENTS